MSTKLVKSIVFSGVMILSLNLLATNSSNELDQGINQLGNMLRDFGDGISQNKESIAVDAQALNLAIQDIMNDPNDSGRRQREPTRRPLREADPNGN
jgi:hypothetical protein